mgnify:CR=1 FL=1
MISYEYFIKEGIIEIGKNTIEKKGDTILLKNDDTTMKFVQVNRRNFRRIQEKTPTTGTAGMDTAHAGEAHSRRIFKPGLDL